MRAIRFASEFGFQIEENTFGAIKELAHHITQASLEKIRDELINLITKGDAKNSMKLLSEVGIVQEIIPELWDHRDMTETNSIWKHTLRMLEGLKNASPELGIAVLLHSLGEHRNMVVEKICNRLNLINKEKKMIVWLVNNYIYISNASEMKLSQLKKFIRNENFEKLLKLYKLYCLAYNKPLNQYEFCIQKFQNITKKELWPIPLINGKDLFKMGYRQGRIYKEILAAVEEGQLNCEINNKSQASAFVKEQFKLELKNL